jgi:sulfatase maturation enzyme AslB (radical SAM superfamily)
MKQKIPIPTSASLLLTETCNLACKYCFVNTADAFCSKFMSKEIAKKSLDYLCNNAVESQVDNFSVMLFGGEPLLNPDVMEYIFEYGLQLANVNNKKFTASIVTNATIMNERIQSIFKKYINLVQLNCQLSIDGQKESQDLYRVTKDGKGSFDIIKKNVPIFKE